MDYIDSRGVPMTPIRFSQALEVIYRLAHRHQAAISRTPHIGRLDWQQQALDTLHDLVCNHHDQLDALTPPPAAQTWPDELLMTDRSMNPEIPLNAIKICLQMAEHGAIKPGRATTIALAEEIDCEEQAIDVTRDLLGLFGSHLKTILLKPISA